jgi:predicted nuclease with RNAse H fold
VGVKRDTLFVGWDVGGWHCDRNQSSRDALVVTCVSNGEVVVVGQPWRGNLRSILVAPSGASVVSAMLNLCGVKGKEVAEVAIAIDTPLGWPHAMMRLAQGGTTSFVSAADGENPYTRRATELELIRRGYAPLSAVRDMLGSQSTKGIHFLRAAALAEVSCGLWRRGDDAGRVVTAIETYPAVALRAPSLRELQSMVIDRTPVGLATAGKPLHDDIRDALACSLVAYLFANHPTDFEPIPTSVPDGEGWIVLPRTD